jgi:hypothetical protein
MNTPAQNALEILRQDQRIIEARLNMAIVHEGQIRAIHDDASEVLSQLMRLKKDMDERIKSITEKL